MSAPPLTELLRGAALFLAEHAGPALGPNAPLAARVQIVARLLESAATELEERPALEAERREALARLLGSTGDLEQLDRQLAAHLRRNPELTTEEDERLRGYFLSALRGELRAVAPGFDTRLHPERPHT